MLYLRSNANGNSDGKNNGNGNGNNNGNSKNNNNSKSWLGKDVHSHPCRDETATWMGHPSFCGWEDNSENNSNRRSFDCVTRKVRELLRSG